MKKMIVANWKMQLSLKESLVLARQFARRIKAGENRIIVCPDYSSLAFLGPIFKNTGLILGAQDSAVSDKGAYTGEVSPLNIKALGAGYVILGHSERREHLHENSAIINKKIKAALGAGLTPILCIGERAEEKAAGRTREYLADELRRSLKGVKIKAASSLFIAYEPVWAISTNKGAKPISPEEAGEIQGYIRIQAKKILKKEIGILYGGSVNAANAASFLAQKNIAGLLVGGASLKAAEFIRIAAAR